MKFFDTGAHGRRSATPWPWRILLPAGIATIIVTSSLAGPTLLGARPAGAGATSEHSIPDHRAAGHSTMQHSTMQHSTTGHRRAEHSTMQGTVLQSSVVREAAGTSARNPAPAQGPEAEPGDVTHHEFQVNCSVTRRLPDDPIVFPGQPGASHDHTFVGNTTTDAHSTLESLLAAGSGATSCLAPDDLSAYWFPTMLDHGEPVTPSGRSVIYYKSGVLDYPSVVPFPQGLRFVVGDMHATQDEFRAAPGAVEGWECGDSFHNWDFPAHCPEGTQLNVRYQAPSCWDGVHLDSADHKSHMAYPVDGRCPAGHPVAVPMVEFKIAFPVDGDMSGVELSSGRGYSWHYDFFNAWDPATQKALVEHCINGGLQCDPRGFDQYKPERGAVLDENYRLP